MLNEEIGTKHLTITGAFVAVLVLFHVALLLQKPALHKATPATAQTAHAEKSGQKTVSGRVTVVDLKAKTLTIAGTKTMTFVWDEKTKIMAAGHAVKPSALVSGAEVTVHYIEKGGTNVASSIVVASVPRRPKKQ